jgi:hypothetical protein
VARPGLQCATFSHSAEVHRILQRKVHAHQALWLARQIQSRHCRHSCRCFPSCSSQHRLGPGIFSHEIGTLPSHRDHLARLLLQSAFFAHHASPEEDWTALGAFALCHNLSPEAPDHMLESDQFQHIHDTATIFTHIPKGQQIERSGPSLIDWILKSNGLSTSTWCNWHDAAADHAFLITRITMQERKGTYCAGRKSLGHARSQK